MVGIWAITKIIEGILPVVCHKEWNIVMMQAHILDRGHDRIAIWGTDPKLQLLDLALVL
jgi:hypothetical protein